MHALDILGDPVRRRLLEVLARGPQPAGVLVDLVGGEFAISQPAISRHLRLLRESGFADADIDGTRRIYRLRPEGLDAASAYLDRLRAPLSQRLDALHTEIARGRSARRREEAAAEPRLATASDIPITPTQEAS
ncbi:MAG: transcriptional regulator [Actinobacteria bacterium]|nr:MAG: transcriptional regulator [Actinomycetota bacterium]HCU78976.1 transcriptional regulator [Microbacterium sp.]|tara:strand:- start:60 stop:461 length:402 start_codon:yes stop_codon:yes gene_type:complete